MDFQEIAENNVGRAMQAIELAGIDNNLLKKRISKLIYYTAEDVNKLQREVKDGDINTRNKR